LQLDNEYDTHQGVDVMRLRILIIVGGLIGVAVVAAAAWYLASPLFIDKTVDEAFPFEVPSQEAMSQMTEAEKAEMEAAFGQAIPSEAQLSQMPEPERQAVATQVMEAALAMPEHEMDEPMPVATMPMEVESTESQATEEQATEAQPAEEPATETPTAEPEPAQPTVVVQGQFQDADSFHKGSGLATIYQLPDGGLILRFEDFSTTNGPDLHVLLASDPAPTSRDDLGDYLDLGSLKGNVGNQNYDIPSDTDLSQYKSVVIYCVPFHVVFATATLG
jgi:hypothetical protein